MKRWRNTIRFGQTRVTDVIAQGLKQLRAYPGKARSMSSSGGRNSTLITLRSTGLNTPTLISSFRQKEADFVDALLKSEGVVIDCLADDEIVTPGQTFTVTLSVYANAGAKLAGFGLVSRSWLDGGEEDR